jgi:hypothetical protein
MDDDDQEDLDKKIAGRDYQGRKSLNYGRHAKLIEGKDAEIKKLRDQNHALRKRILGALYVPWPGSE